VIANADFERSLFLPRFSFGRAQGVQPGSPNQPEVMRGVSAPRHSFRPGRERRDANGAPFRTTHRNAKGVTPRSSFDEADPAAAGGVCRCAGNKPGCAGVNVAAT